MCPFPHGMDVSTVQVPQAAPVRAEVVAPVRTPVPVRAPAPVRTPVPARTPVPVQTPVPVRTPAPVSTAVPVRSTVPLRTTVPLRPMPVSSAPTPQVKAAQVQQAVSRESVDSVESVSTSVEDATQLVEMMDIISGEGEEEIDYIALAEEVERWLAYEEEERNR